MGRSVRKVGVATQGNMRNPCGDKSVQHFDWINDSIRAMALYYNFAMCYIEENWVKRCLGFLAMISYSCM